LIELAMITSTKSARGTAMDILEIFKQACDAAQIAHSSSKFDTISIARREAVAALDAFIGPKS
jgi:hypothetical protein